MSVDPYSKISTIIQNLWNWGLHSDVAKVILLVAIISGIPIIALIWTSPMRNPISYIESKGYSYVNMKYNDSKNCQSGYNGTLFYATYNNNDTGAFVLYESKFTDSVYIRELRRKL